MFKSPNSNATVTPQGENSNTSSGLEKIDSNSSMSESSQNASSNNSVMIKDDRFLDKVIVITGAGGSFGRDGCIYFAQRGARIAALEINSPSLAETVSAVSNACPWGAQVCALECNVTSAEAVRDTMDIVQTKLGPIDMLWNNAGYQGEIKPTLEYDPQDFAKVMEINVTGMFIVLQAVARCMAQENRGGSIVNTASVAGLRGTPAMVAYVSSKAAVLGMTGSYKLTENSAYSSRLGYSVMVRSRLVTRLAHI
jgi:NAD(P)-dependent dehydrogenase (short-subunit alcohol dehydrogenase family)